jgi:hypothetical protein
MITQKELKEVLEYNPETGVFTRIKSSNNPVKIGSIAGTIDKNGYRRITLNGKRYLAHRLAYFYMTGNFPENQIDHINHIRNDNRWTNLRPATKSENQSNAKISKRNTTGYKGVSYDKRRNKYRAEICHNHNRIKLGSYTTAIEAHAAYISMAKKLNKEFACWK